MNAVQVKNCSKSSKRTTKNFKKYKRKCKITWKSSVQLFQDSISYQTMSFYKSFHKPETHMLFNHI